jgi:hypothetical protein
MAEMKPISTMKYRGMLIMQTPHPLLQTMVYILHTWLSLNFLIFEQNG